MKITRKQLRQIINEMIESSIDAEILSDSDVDSDVSEVSPPRWRGTVEKMKDDDIDNPWALAWWMKDKGYNPHYKDDGKKYKKYKKKKSGGG